MITLNRSQIEQILPHRSPMLLLEEAHILTTDTSTKAGLTKSPSPEAAMTENPAIEAIITVAPDWDILKGHFPRQPILPGVCLIEGMAQAAGLLLLHQQKNHKKTPLLLQVSSMRFLHPVLPEDTVTVSAQLVLDAGSGIYDFKVSARTLSARSATGTLTLALRQALP